MNSPQHELRRATLDDLAGLRRLWEQAGLPSADLERRLTEFQVAAGSDGALGGCIGLQMENRHGRIHSEAYASLALQAELRAGLWNRVQAVARNHGLVRLWICERDGGGPENGFRLAGSEELKNRPPGFGLSDQAWFTLQLREETDPAISVEREFELFKHAQRELSEKSLRQARVLRLLAGLVAAGTLALALGLAWYVLRHLPALRKR